MPYIPAKLREDIDRPIPNYGRPPEHAGELNYLITSFIHNYLMSKKLSYKAINEVIGVLECAKLELYRQIAAPYENKKKRDNGSVSDLDAPTLEDVR